MYLCISHISCNIRPFTPADSPEDQWPDITSTEKVMWDSIPSVSDSGEQTRAAAEEQAMEEKRRLAELERHRKEKEER